MGRRLDHRAHGQQFEQALGCTGGSLGVDLMTIHSVGGKAMVAAARAAADEFGALFVSAGNPRLNPYECFYVAGCLMDKPLALLRSDLQALGLARREGATELEDHLGALCEAMRLLIERGADTLQQAGFFERHLGGWAGACLDDTRHAAGADFYRALADFTGAFFAAEAGRFGLEPVAVAGEGPTAHQRRTGALQP